MNILKQKLIIPLRMLCNLLLLVAPIIVVQTNCALLWGEPECPDCLKIEK